MPADPNANYTHSALRIGDVNTYPERKVGVFIGTVVLNQRSTTNTSTSSSATSS